MEEKELKERFFERFFYAEDGSRDWDRWRKQDPSVVLEFILEELDRAREEGYQNCMDDIWEKARGLRSWTEHDGSVSAGDIEAGLREAYLEIEEELSKSTTK